MACSNDDGQPPSIYHFSALIDQPDIRHRVVMDTREIGFNSGIPNRFRPSREGLGWHKKYFGVPLLYLFWVRVPYDSWIDLKSTTSGLHL